MRKVTLACLAALALAAPAHGEGGEPRGEPEEKAKAKPRVVRIAGPILRLSETAIAVENRVGDAMLTCLLPEGKARRVAAAFEVGDAVRMHCLRHRGKRAVLLKLLPLERPKPPAKPAVRQEAVGAVAELGEAAIVVQSRDRRLACRVPAEKRAKLAGLKVGDVVKILCAGGVLVGLERPTPVDEPKPEPKAGDEARLYGRIAELSREAVTVRGESGSLTCRVPAGLAEKLSRFAVGDAVKMMCRGSELTYLEKTA